MDRHLALFDWLFAPRKREPVRTQRFDIADGYNLRWRKAAAPGAFLSHLFAMLFSWTGTISLRPFVDFSPLFQLWNLAKFVFLVISHCRRAISITYPTELPNRKAETLHKFSTKWTYETQLTTRAFSKLYETNFQKEIHCSDQPVIKTGDLIELQLFLCSIFATRSMGNLLARSWTFWYISPDRLIVSTSQFERQTEK